MRRTAFVVGYVSNDSTDNEAVKHTRTDLRGAHIHMFRHRLDIQTFVIFSAVGRNDTDRFNWEVGLWGANVPGSIECLMRCLDTSLKSPEYRVLSIRNECNYPRLIGLDKRCHAFSTQTDLELRPLKRRPWYSNNNEPSWKRTSSMRNSDTAII